MLDISTCSVTEDGDTLARVSRGETLAAPFAISLLFYTYESTRLMICPLMQARSTINIFYYFYLKVETFKVIFLGVGSACTFK